MKKIILSLLGVSLVLLFFVVAQLSIYIPVGEPLITSLTYSSESINADGLDLIVKNIGTEEGSFQITASCDHNWEADWNSGNSYFRVGAGTSETTRIHLVCHTISEEDKDTKCYGSVNCEIVVADANSFGDKKDTKKIGFQAIKPSFCGTVYSWCDRGKLRCDHNRLMKCSDNCDSFQLVMECTHRCGWKEGDMRCISKSEDRTEKVKTFLIIFGFIGGFIAIIIFLLSRFKGKKVNLGITKAKPELKNRSDGGKYCRSCGTKISKDTNFCGSCGKKIS